jgi:hypothetical protein
MTKRELNVIYELRSLIEKMYYNELHDHNNPMQADIRTELFNIGQRVANEIINKYPPLKEN